MNDRPSTAVQRAIHWEHVYEDKNPETVSWYQPEPMVSMDLIGVLCLAAKSRIIDIGGGASLLVDRLLARRFTDLTVLDISEAALEATVNELAMTPE